MGIIYIAISCDNYWAVSLWMGCIFGETDSFGKNVCVDNLCIYF